MSGSAERIVPLSAGADGDGQRHDASRQPPGNRDWAASLSLLKRAGDTVKAADDQTHKVISRAEATLLRANE